jgi:hypothetical protein
MDMNLTSEERVQLELIALHAGKSTGKVLLEAAEFLLEHDVDSWQYKPQHQPASRNQTFLRDEDLDARFAELLRR